MRALLRVADATLRTPAEVAAALTAGQVVQADAFYRLQPPVLERIEMLLATLCQHAHAAGVDKPSKLRAIEFYLQRWRPPAAVEQDAAAQSAVAAVIAP